MVKKQSAEIDPLLEPLLQLTDDERAGDLLSQLITLHAEPIIWIDPSFSLLEALVANSCWRGHLKNLWRILVRQAKPG